MRIRFAIMFFFFFFSCALLASRGQAQSVAPATYRVWLCASSCAPADSSRAVAEAIVVIIDDSVAATSEARAKLAAFPRNLTRPPSSLPDNACFRVIRHDQTVNGEELFWGIIPRAATRVVHSPKPIATFGQSATLTIEVYRSPDAFYHLVWREDEMFAKGEGWSDGPSMTTPSHRNAFFATLRVGAADISRCLDSR